MTPNGRRELKTQIRCAQMRLRHLAIFDLPVKLLCNSRECIEIDFGIVPADSSDRLSRGPFCTGRLPNRAYCQQKARGPDPRVRPIERVVLKKHVVF